MGKISELKCACEDFEVEIEVLPVFETDSDEEQKKKYREEISNIDEQLSVLEDKVALLNKDIDRLTSHADGIDLAISVTSGIITGIIDATVVGEWNFAEARQKETNKIEKKVIEFAKKHPQYVPYCKFALEGQGNPRRSPKNPDELETAIEFLEWKFHLPGDGAYKSGNYGISGYTHRLDDLCHHPTLVGLVCCVIVQFTGSTIYVNKYGEDINIPITVNEYGKFVGNNPVTKLFSGVINWFITCAQTIANRKGHLMSDIATPSSIPGSLLSIIDELASIPCFRDAAFLSKLRDAFVNGFSRDDNRFIDWAVLFDGAENKFDIKTEKAIVHELKRQAIPVLINEVLVRGAYFIRRFIKELKEKQDVKAIEWNNVIPFKNRTIVRMMTVATSVFTAVDLADAAIHSATKSVDVSTFFTNMLLRVNFVGVGRMGIAVATDVGMGISRSHKINERMNLYTEQIHLLDAKVYYKQAGMWISAEDAGKTVEEAYTMMEKAAEEVADSYAEIKNSLNSIGEMREDIEEKNPGLIDDINDVLEWG